MQCMISQYPVLHTHLENYICCVVIVVVIIVIIIIIIIIRHHLGLVDLFQSRLIVSSKIFQSLSPFGVYCPVGSEIDFIVGSLAHRWQRYACRQMQCLRRHDHRLQYLRIPQLVIDADLD